MHPWDPGVTTGRRQEPFLDSANGLMMTEKVQSPPPDTEPREAVIRKFQAGDEKPLNDLFNAVFNRNRSLNGWNWKFKGHPQGKANFVTVAEANGEIIGEYPNIVLPFKYLDSQQFFGHALDSCVHPNYRGGIRGVLAKIFFYTVRWYCDEDVWIGFGFPNHAHYVVGKRVLGYRDIATVPMLYRRLSFRLALLRRAPWLPSHIIELVGRGSALVYWIRLGGRPLGLRTRVTIRRITSFDQRFDRLWERAKEGYAISAIRDKESLNWRYVEKPQDTHDIFAAERDGNLLGFIVGKVKEEGTHRVGLLMDVLTAPQDAPGVDDLLVRRLFRHFIGCRVDYVQAWMLPHDRLYPSLIRQGMFEREGQPKVHMIYVITSPGKPDENVIREAKNWHLTLGDSEEYII